MPQEPWRIDRTARILDPSRPRPVVELGDPSFPDLLFRSGEILVNELAQDQLHLSSPEYTDLTDGAHPHLFELGLRLFRIENPDAPEPALTSGRVALLREQARQAAEDHGVDPGLVVVSLHYVFGGDPKYHGGPAGAPASTGASAWKESPITAVDGAPVAAVLDTGFYPKARAGLAGSVRFDPVSDLDPLLSPTGQLGAQAGHGTFIAGVIARMAGESVTIACVRALDDPFNGGADGIGDDSSVARELIELSKLAVPPRVLNMSFSTTTTETAMPAATAQALQLFPVSTVVVASAGNCDPKASAATKSQPRWPAAGAGVASVSSVARSGKGYQAVSTSNRGSWVLVSSLGEDVLSTYVDGTFPGVEPAFAGWARWSGTSFATALVSAEILRRSLANKVTARSAWESMKTNLPRDPKLADFGALFDPVKKGIGIDPAQP